MKLKRQPTKSELRHIATKIWCVCIDFQSVREYEDMDSFYKDVIAVINSEMTLDSFTSSYVGDSYDELTFDIVYDTIKYMAKKGIISGL